MNEIDYGSTQTRNRSTQENSGALGTGEAMSQAEIARELRITAEMEAREPVMPAPTIGKVEGNADNKKTGIVSQVRSIVTPGGRGTVATPTPRSTEEVNSQSLWNASMDFIRSWIVGGVIAQEENELEAKAFKEFQDDHILYRQFKEIEPIIGQSPKSFDFVFKNKPEDQNKAVFARLRSGVLRNIIRSGSASKGDYTEYAVLQQFLEIEQCKLEYDLILKYFEEAWKFEKEVRRLTEVIGFTRSKLLSAEEYQSNQYLLEKAKHDLIELKNKQEKIIRIPYLKRVISKFTIDYRKIEGERRELEQYSTLPDNNPKKIEYLIVKANCEELIKQIEITKNTLVALQGTVPLSFAIPENDKDVINERARSFQARWKRGVRLFAHNPDIRLETEAVLIERKLQQGKTLEILGGKFQGICVCWAMNKSTGQPEYILGTSGQLIAYLNNEYSLLPKDQAVYNEKKRLPFIFCSLEDLPPPLKVPTNFQFTTASSRAFFKSLPRARETSKIDSFVPGNFQKGDVRIARGKELLFDSNWVQFPDQTGKLIPHSTFIDRGALEKGTLRVFVFQIVKTVKGLRLQGKEIFSTKASSLITYQKEQKCLNNIRELRWDSELSAIKIEEESQTSKENTASDPRVTNNVVKLNPVHSPIPEAHDPIGAFTLPDTPNIPAEKPILPQRGTSLGGFRITAQDAPVKKLTAVQSGPEAKKPAFVADIEMMLQKMEAGILQAREDEKKAKQEACKAKGEVYKEEIQKPQESLSAIFAQSAFKLQKSPQLRRIASFFIGERGSDERFFLRLLLVIEYLAKEFEQKYIEMWPNFLSQNIPGQLRAAKECLIKDGCIFDETGFQHIASKQGFETEPLSDMTFICKLFEYSETEANRLYGVLNLRQKARIAQKRSENEAARVEKAEQAAKLKKEIRIHEIEMQMIYGRLDRP